MPASAITKRIFSRVNCAQASGIFAIKKEEGRGKKEEGRRKREEEGRRGKKEEGGILSSIEPMTYYPLPITYYQS